MQGAPEPGASPASKAGIIGPVECSHFSRAQRAEKLHRTDSRPPTSHPMSLLASVISVHQNLIRHFRWHHCVVAGPSAILALPSPGRIRLERPRSRWEGSELPGVHLAVITLPVQSLRFPSMVRLSYATELAPRGKNPFLHLAQAKFI